MAWRHLRTNFKVVGGIILVKVFFRNDDVGTPGKRFSLLNRIFIERGIPIHHAVVPKNLTGNSAQELIEIQTRAPEIIEYGQHGYSHENHGNRAIKTEFAGRSLEEQRNDIENGKKIMESSFGPESSTVFSPPWNRCDMNTLRVLEELGFKILSSKMDPKLNLDGSGIGFAPVILSFNVKDYHTGKFKTDLNNSIRMFRNADNTQTPFGVNIHHDMLGGQDFKNLILFLKYMKKERVEFCRLSCLGDEP